MFHLANIVSFRRQKYAEKANKLRCSFTYICATIERITNRSFPPLPSGGACGVWRRCMKQEKSTEQLEYASAEAQQKDEKQLYTPRPKSQIILAWVLIAVVVLAILGSCYWQIFGKF